MMFLVQSYATAHNICFTQQTGYAGIEQAFLKKRTWKCKNLYLLQQNSLTWSDNLMTHEVKAEYDKTNKTLFYSSVILQDNKNLSTSLYLKDSFLYFSYHQKSPRYKRFCNVKNTTFNVEIDCDSKAMLWPLLVKKLPSD